LAVKIRLKRLGKKKQPFYRVVVADSRAPRDGRSIEKLGHYNPITDPAELVINEERLFHWLDEGAIPSDTVFSLLRNRGITLKYELTSRNADEATINKEMQKWELAQEEKTKRKAAAEAEKKIKAEAAKEEAEEAVEESAEETVAEEAAEETPADTPTEEASAEETPAEEEAAAEEAVEEAPAEETAEEAPAEEAVEEAPAEETAEEAPAEEPAEESEKEDS